MLTRRLHIASAVSALILPLALPAPADAQTPAPGVQISGMGTRKCSEWQEWKESRNGEARAMALEWAQGFIAGHNVYTRHNAEPVTSIVADVNVLIPLMDSFCDRSPDNRLLTVIVQITQSLGGAKIRAEPRAPARKPQKRAPPADTPT